jgi:hypothetical protein
VYGSVALFRLTETDKTVRNLEIISIKKNFQFGLCSLFQEFFKYRE